MSPRKKKEEDGYEDIYEKDDEDREYRGNVPSGCAACGGPYPSCMSSCPMFDD